MLNRCTMIALALLTTGCLNWRGPHHAAAGAELAAAGAAVDAWIAAGREDPRAIEGCRAMTRTEIVIVSPYPEGRSPCVYIENEERRYGAACMSVVQPYVGAPAHLAIYLDSSLEDEGRLNGVSHETLHFVRGCVLRDVDRAHSDAELWGSILDQAIQTR